MDNTVDRTGSIIRGKKILAFRKWVCYSNGVAIEIFLCYGCTCAYIGVIAMLPMAGVMGIGMYINIKNVNTMKEVTK